MVKDDLLSPVASVGDVTQYKVNSVNISRIEKPPGRHTVITPERESELRSIRARERKEFGSDYNVIDGLLDLISELRKT